MAMATACSAPPYTGGEPFILLCYSRADEGEAYTLTEHLACAGFRVYYAQAEATPEQPVQETTGLLNARLGDCAALIALYSPEAAQSHGFRKVVTSAVLNGKPLIPVFLEDFELSPGMRAQLEPTARLSWFGMNGELPPLERFEAAACARGEPNPAICVKPRGPRLKEEAVPPEREKRRWPVSAILIDEEEVFRQMGLSPEQAEAWRRPAQKRTSPPQEPVPAGTAAAPPREVGAAGCDPREHRSSRPYPRTVLIGEEGSAGDRGPEAGRGRNGTLILEEIPPVCVLLSTGERVPGQYGLTCIGRSESCEIQIPEYTVSSRHMEVFSFANADGSFRNTLVDCHSSNGTWVNGRRLAGGESISVGRYAHVSLGRNVPLLLAFGHEAQALMQRDALYSLECVETQEAQILFEEELVLGRCDSFGNGFFDYPQISWEHARLRCAGGEWSIMDLSSNGTCVNGKKIAKHSECALRNGDEITMGYHRYALRRIALRERGVAHEGASRPL